MSVILSNNFASFPRPFTCLCLIALGKKSRAVGNSGSETALFLCLVLGKVFFFFKLSLRMILPWFVTGALNCTVVIISIYNPLGICPEKLFKFCEPVLYYVSLICRIYCLCVCVLIVANQEKFHLMWRMIFFLLSS